MESASVRNATIAAVLLLILVAVGIWLTPKVKRWLDPFGEAATGLQEGLDARLHPTPTIRPSPSTIIQQVRSLSRLETVSYTIEKVITAESGQDALAFLFGDRLLFVAHGQVIAGVDLGQMQEGDITIAAGDRVVVVMPPAEVFFVVLDEEKSFVYDRDTGLLGLNMDLETAARQAAKEEILNAALEDGILQKADANARLYLERLIMALGFQEVVFVQATPAPHAPVLAVTVLPTTPQP